jgi:hypothetical protein
MNIGTRPPSNVPEFAEMMKRCDGDLPSMSTLSEIQNAVETLPQKQKLALLHFLEQRLRPSVDMQTRAVLIEEGDAAVLAVPPGAPIITPENNKRMLEAWP